MLTIKNNGEELILVIEDEEINNLTFTKSITLNEIKELDNYFNNFISCDEFSKYLKDLVKNKKLTIMKKEENLCLNFTVDNVSQKKIIELILLSKEKERDELLKELYKEINILKEKIKILENRDSVENEDSINENNNLINIISELKTDNENLKEEVKYLKEEIKQMKLVLEPIKKRFSTYNEKSLIMKEDEFNFIKLIIEVKINKKIKKLNKLYQALFDGDSAQMFHSKCDDIPNTLVIIKSAGNRRFGGFTIKEWSSTYNESYAFDKNAFLFSFDK